MSSHLLALVSAERRRLLLLAVPALVHAVSTAHAAGGQGRPAGKAAAAPGASKAGPGPIVGRDPAKLPPAVADMRAAILAAVESGDILELKHAIELNEMKPEFGAAPGADPIAHFKGLSGDGHGREILAILGRLLDGPWASIPGGRDVENNRMYVWPAFAELPLGSLKPAEEVELFKLVTPAEAKAMRAANRWLWWRLTIGADGVWHTFVREK